MVYWEAFQDLQTERRAPRGMIPINAIADYCQTYGLDPDRVKRIIWKVDKVLLDHWKSKDESDERQRKALRDQKPTLGGQS
jgi:hypothetical protein